jgi:hypothetical protein
VKIIDGQNIRRATIDGSALSAELLRSTAAQLFQLPASEPFRLGYTGALVSC